MDIELSGLVFLIDEKELPKKYRDDYDRKLLDDKLFGIKNKIFDVKTIDGPLINGLIVITIVIKEEIYSLDTLISFIKCEIKGTLK